MSRCRRGAAAGRFRRGGGAAARRAGRGPRRAHRGRPGDGLADGSYNTGVVVRGMRRDDLASFPAWPAALSPGALDYFGATTA